MKKIFSVLVSIIIVVASLGIWAVADVDYEAYIGNVGYTTFDEAIVAANNSSDPVTITVDSNFSKSGDNAQYTITKAMTIDFNGHKMTLDGNQAFLVSAGVEVNINNGRLITNFIGTQSRYIFKTTNEEAVLNINDFVIEMNNVTPQSGASFYAEKGNVNLFNVTYNYVSIRTSYGAILGANSTAKLTAKNCVFNCDYSSPTFLFATTTANIELYNSTFNKVNDYTILSQASKSVEISRVVPDCCTLTWNEYNTGFTVNCTHSFDLNDKCIYCSATKKEYGDVDSDGEVTLKDCLVLKRHLAGYNDSINTNNAMVTNGNKVSLKDLLRIKKYLAKEINELDPILDVNVDSGDVAKEIHFEYSTPNYTGSTSNDRAVLMLPKGYSKTGEPTRLVIDVHGYSVVIDERNTYIDSSVYTYVSSFVHNGFAVLNTQALNLGHCGGKYAIQAIINSYKYVIENYNICTDGVYVNGNSMGGISSINLVCSGEIPVLAQTLHYPISSTYRQTYTNGWIDGLRNLTAKYSGFSVDEYNEANGTSYTLNNFPFTSSKNSPSQEELDLYKYNFFTNIANKYSIFKYTNIIAQDGASFNEGFENFLTESDSDKVDEMYEKITVDYPVPVFFTQCLNDTDKNVWAQKLVRAMQRGNSDVTYKWYEGTKHGGAIGPEVTFTTKDGTQITSLESSYTLAQYFLDFEQSLAK